MFFKAFVCIFVIGLTQCSYFTQADRRIQKIAALWCFPAQFCQASSADLQTMILFLISELLHSSTTQNGSLWNQRSPSQNSQCLLLSPAEHTRCQQPWSHSPRPQQNQAGQRGHSGRGGVRLMSTVTHMDIKAQQFMRRSDFQPLAAVEEIREVIPLLYLLDMDNSRMTWSTLLTREDSSRSDDTYQWKCHLLIWLKERISMVGFLLFTLTKPQHTSLTLFLEDGKRQPNQ